MATKPIDSIDVAQLPDLLRIVDEVRTGARPRLLRRGNEPMAIIVPIEPGAAVEIAKRPRTSSPHRRRERTAEDWAAFRSAAGAWEDVDADKLVDDIYAARDAGDRPPVEL